MKDLKNELMKIGTELSESDKEVQEWHQWFLRQTELYKNSKMSKKVYLSILERYRSLLEKKTTKSISYAERSILKEEIKDVESPEEDIKMISSSSVTCTSCGEQNSPLTQFCIHCGQSIAIVTKVSHDEVIESLDLAADKEEITEPEAIPTSVDDSDKKIVPSDARTQQAEIFELTKKSEVKILKDSQISPIIPKQRVSKVLIEDIGEIKRQRERKSQLKLLRDTQNELSGLITRRTYIIGVGSFILALLIIIALSDQEAINRISIGLILLAFLSTVLSLVIDILRGRNFAEWSALGAIICYFGIFLIFIPLLVYVILPTGITDLLVFIAELFGIVLLIIGVTLRWTEYDEKLVNLVTITIGYWKTYQKRKAIKTFLIAIGTFCLGIIKAIGGGFRRLPSRFKAFLGIVKQFFADYGKATIIQLLTAITRLSEALWNHAHWIGLLAILVYLWLTGFSTYQNIELLIIMSFFFILGVLYSNSERINKVVSGTRITILKGVISAYSMLTGTRIKTEEAIFCSRCLRGVHEIEYEELKHVEQKQIPECPYCGHENWVTVN